MSPTTLQMGAPVPFKRLASPSLGKMLQPEATGTASVQVPYLKAGHVQWHGVALPEDLPLMWASPTDIQDLTPAAGDLLICEGGEVGRAALAPIDLPENTIIQNSLHLVRETDSACPRYLKYALEHVAASGWIDLICNKATIAHLTVDKLRELPTPYWGKQDQQRIATFLDEQTARIDALIAEKERLMVLLSEQRLSIAERVMADSASGTKAKLGFHADFLAGYAFPSDEFSRDESDIPLLRGVNVAPASIRWDDVVYWRRDYDTSLERFRLQAGDVVFGMDRPWISSGARVAMIDADSAGAFLLQRVCRLRGGSKMRQRFLFYALSSDAFRQSIEVDLTGVSVPHISPEQVLGFKVPVLTPEEQDVRCAEADRQTEALQGLATHTDGLLNRLREYRSSLISAAVTGQLDLSTFKKAVQ